MKRFVSGFIIVILITSCKANSNMLSTKGGKDNSTFPSQTESPTQTTQADTESPIQEKTPEYSVGMILGTIESPVYRFSWSQDSDTLHFASSPELNKWSTYPEGNSDSDIQDVYPVLSNDVAEKIGFYDLSAPPKYSISPSGRNVLYWKQVFTRPTPTPAQGEVSLTEFEWLFDVYLFSADDFTEHYIARFDGWILDAFWSNEEDQVFLKFDQLQVPSEHILINIDIASGTFEEVIPSGIDDIYPWVAISPDDSLILFQEKSQSNQVVILDMLTGKVTQYSDLPLFTVIYWLDDSNWLLVSNFSEGSMFIIYDYTSGQERFRMEFSFRIMNFEGSAKPVLASSRNQLAFTGYYNRDYGTLALHILSISYNEK